MSTAQKAAAAKQASEYDEAKLEAMTEPLTVNVEKLIAGRPQPIELPIKPGEVNSGVGWSKNDVRDLPTFLGRKATGSGLVRIKVTDVNQVVMRWEWFFSPQDYQSLPAPSNDPLAPVMQQQPAVNLGGSVMQQQPQQAYVQPMPDPYQGWLGTVARQGVPGSMQPLGTYRSQFQPAGFQTPGAPGAQAMYPQFSIPPSIVQGPAAADDRLREEREARLRLEGEISRKDLEHNYKAQIGAVSNEVRQLQTAISGIANAMQRPAAEEAASATTRALEAKIAALEAASREDKMVALIAANQQQTMQMIQAMQANTDRQLAALATKPVGPDPMIMMMMEGQKQAAAQNMQFLQMMMTQQTAGQAGQLGTRETIELMKSMNVGSEQQAAAFSKAWELMMQGVETILHAQGPGVHPAVEMLGQGIAAAAGIGEKFVEMKDNVGKQTANAMAMQAQANMHLANQLAAQRQQQQLAGPQPVVTAGQPAPKPATAIEPEEPETEEEGEEGEEEEATQPKPSSPVQHDPVLPPEPVMDSAARADRMKADREAFGPALAAIKKLRKSVKDGHLDPLKAAASILKGVDEIMKLKVQIPAMELWRQGQLAECIELMLPETTVGFRERIIEAIVAFVQNAQQQAAGQQPEQAS